MSFKLECKNALMHKPINNRIERHGEDEVNAIDLYFLTETDAGVMHFLLSGENSGNPPEFWTDVTVIIRYHGLKGDIASTAEFDDCYVKFKDVVIKECKVGKFKMTPINQRKIMLEFKVALTPDDNQLTRLVHYQKKGGKLLVKTDSLFDPIEEARQKELDYEEGEE